MLVREVSVRLPEIALDHVAVPGRLAQQPGLHVRAVRQPGHEHVPETESVEHRPRIRPADGRPSVKVLGVAVHQYGRALPRVALARVTVRHVPEIVQVDQAPPSRVVVDGGEKLPRPRPPEVSGNAVTAVAAVCRENFEKHEERRAEDQEQYEVLCPSSHGDVAAAVLVCAQLPAVRYRPMIRLQNHTTYIFLHS